MDHILLTDGQQRKTLAAVRSLGSQGDRVSVADVTRFSLSRFSRYCHQGLLCPSPEDADNYWRWLVDTCRTHGIETVLPMDDLTTALLVERSSANGPCRALVPTAEQFHTGRDKGLTAALAVRAGIRVPRTVPVQSLAEAHEAARHMGYCAVVKARQSAGGRGIFFVAAPTDVDEAWRRFRPEWGGPLVQERIPLGRKFDVCLLFGAAGDLRATFVQEELRWFPLEFGASTLQESVHRPDLVDLALRLLAPIGWRGPVEVEFMLDPNGEAVLMEINPRYWASLALSIQCGVDFPRLTAALAAGRDVHGPAAYPAGRRCRWLIPGDVLHAAAAHGRGMNPPFFATYDARTSDDTFSLRDPGPAAGLLLAMLRYSLDPAMWRMLMRW